MKGMTVKGQVYQRHYSKGGTRERIEGENEGE
jgi:hypothetical protein